MARLKPPADPDYKAAYNKGWAAGHRGGSGALDRADASLSTPAAWYEGYSDAATGRDKWHRAHCPKERHHNGPGGCGEA